MSNMWSSGIDKNKFSMEKNLNEILSESREDIHLLDSHIVSSNLPDDLPLMNESFLQYIVKKWGVSSNTFAEQLRLIQVEKCASLPSYYATYIRCLDIFSLFDKLNHNDIWQQVLFSSPMNNMTSISHDLYLMRKFYTNEVVIYLIGIGGGFKSFGTMDNYSAFMGGVYTQETSYRQYKP